MVSRKFNYFYIVVVCAAIVFLGSCRKESPSGIIRMVEKLQTEHVLETPYSSAIEPLNPIEEVVGDRWEMIPQLSNDRYHVWGFSTRYPVLKGNRSIPNVDGTVVKRDGALIPPGVFLSGKDLAWEVYDDDGKINLQTFSGFQGRLDGIDLGGSPAFILNRLFPKGKVLLDVNIEGNTPKQKGAAFEVLLEGKLIHTRVLSQRQWYRVEFINPSTGEKPIQIRLNKTFPDVTIVLRRARVETNGDVIFLSVPQNGSLKKPEGEYTLNYFTNVGIPEQNLQPVSQEDLFLYHFCSRSLNRDREIGENPWGIKKKLQVGGHTLDALAAPPLSRFKIPVKVPENARLTLGYGIFQDKKIPQREQIINFQILVEYKGNTKTHWKKRIRATSLDWFLPAEIDLSSYGGKTIDLMLVTEEIPLKKGERKNNLCCPFWMAPVLSGPPKENEPNVILISLDTVRPDHLKSYGYHRDTSPAVDGLAGDGVLFENVYSTTSWTLPAHMSLMTGLNGPSHGVYLPYHKIGDSTVPLGDRVKSRFAATVAFTGGGYLSSTFGFARGFDHYYEIRFGIEKDFRTNEAEKLGRKTSEWLKRNGRRRFFMFIHTYQPHDPYANGSTEGKAFLSASSNWDEVRMSDVFGDGGRLGSHLTPEQRTNVVDLYDGEILHTDTYLVAPVIKTLKSLDLYDNTMIIVTSDHGEEFYDHQGWLHDHSLYEEGTRIPLIVKFPGSRFKSKRIKGKTRITDIAPTILDLLGAGISNGEIDGSSLMPMVTGKEKGNRDIFQDLALRQTKIPYPHIMAIIQDNFKLILNREMQSPYIKKVSKQFMEQQVELYHLVKDPKETYNMVANSKYWDRIKQMLRQIQSYYQDRDIRRKTGDEADVDQNLMDRLRSLGYLD